MLSYSNNRNEEKELEEAQLRDRNNLSLRGNTVLNYNKIRKNEKVNDYEDLVNDRAKNRSSCLQGFHPRWLGRQ